MLYNKQYIWGETMEHFIKIMEAVYKEHGLQETVRRLTMMFAINLGSEKVKSLEFSGRSIIFKCKNPITFTIEEDFYTVSKQYSDYKTINWYDKRNNPFRKTVFFDTKDDEVLALDSFCAEQVESMRFIKTSKEDTELLEPTFEREFATFPSIDTDERSRYTEYSNDDTEGSKEIDLVDNYYYYDLYSIDEEQRFLETAASLDTPKDKVYGRTTNNRDLLYEAENHPYPSVQFRGNTVDDNRSTTTYFDVTASKIPEEGLMSIQIELVDQLDGSGFHYNHILPNLSRGPITLKDLVLLSHFIERLNYPFSEQLIDSLTKLRNKMLIRDYKKMPEYDVIELTMRMIPEFEELAFHVYERLDHYNDMIRELSHRELSENRKKTLS